MRSRTCKPSRATSSGAGPKRLTNVESTVPSSRRDASTTAPQRTRLAAAGVGFVRHEWSATASSRIALAPGLNGSGTAALSGITRQSSSRRACGASARSTLAFVPDEPASPTMPRSVITGDPLAVRFSEYANPETRRRPESASAVTVPRLTTTEGKRSSTCRTTQAEASSMVRRGGRWSGVRSAGGPTAQRHRPSSSESIRNPWTRPPMRMLEPSTGPSVMAVVGLLSTANARFRSPSAMTTPRKGQSLGPTGSPTSSGAARPSHAGASDEPGGDAVMESRPCRLQPDRCQLDAVGGGRQ